MTIQDSLGLDPTSRDVGIHKTPDKKIDTAVTKFINHPSISAIKRKIDMDHKFEFRFVNLLHVSDNLPTKLIQEVKEVICLHLASSINATMGNCLSG